MGEIYHHNCYNNFTGFWHNTSCVGLSFHILLQPWEQNVLVQEIVRFLVGFVDEAGSLHVQPVVGFCVDGTTKTTCSIHRHPFPHHCCLGYWKTLLWQWEVSQSHIHFSATMVMTSKSSLCYHTVGGCPAGIQEAWIILQSRMVWNYFRRLSRRGNVALLIGLLLFILVTSFLPPLCRCMNLIKAIYLCKM